VGSTAGYTRRPGSATSRRGESLFQPGTSPALRERNKRPDSNEQGRIEGAGTFLRPTAPGLILEGKSFKEAFESKYCDAQADGAMDQRDITNNHEVDGTTSHFYKTSSNFEVEVVLSEKVAARFRHLGRLREDVLEWEALSRAHDSDERGGENSLREFGQKLAGKRICRSDFRLTPRKKLTFRGPRSSRRRTRST
jgi:hypothetical protein